MCPNPNTSSDPLITRPSLSLRPPTCLLVYSAQSLSFAAKTPESVCESFGARAAVSGAPAALGPDAVAAVLGLVALHDHSLVSAIDQAYARSRMGVLSNARAVLGHHNGSDPKAQALAASFHGLTLNPEPVSSDTLLCLSQKPYHTCVLKPCSTSNSLGVRKSNRPAS